MALSPSTIVTDAQTKLATLANAINTFVSGFGGADIAAATALATTNNDAAAVACWGTIKTLALLPIPPGAGIAYLIQYARMLVQYQGAVNTNCGQVLPAFVDAYNQMVAALINFGNSTLAPEIVAAGAGAVAATPALAAVA